MQSPTFTQLYLDLFGPIKLCWPHLNDFLNPAPAQSSPGGWQLILVYPGTFAEWLQISIGTKFESINVVNTTQPW